jgi:hypothetical protein
MPNKPLPLLKQGVYHCILHSGGKGGKGGIYPKTIGTFYSCNTLQKAKVERAIPIAALQI